jgi:hypothetical protein
VSEQNIPVPYSNSTTTTAKKIDRELGSQQRPKILGRLRDSMDGTACLLVSNDLLFIQSGYPYLVGRFTAIRVVLISA